MMTPRPVEELAMAIIAYTNYSDCNSLQYRLRNPLMLQRYCAHAMRINNCDVCKANPVLGAKNHPYDKDSGLRMFESHVDGMSAALYDLVGKCSGKFRRKVSPMSTLKELMRAYDLPERTAEPVVRRLRRVLSDEALTSETPIGYFMGVRKEEEDAGREREYQLGTG